MYLDWISKELPMRSSKFKQGCDAFRYSHLYTNRAETQSAVRYVWESFINIICMYWLKRKTLFDQNALVGIAEEL